MVASTLLVAVFDDRDGVGGYVRHVGSGSVRRDRYMKRTEANRNGRSHGVGRSVDDRDEVGVTKGAASRHVGSGLSMCRCGAYSYSHWEKEEQQYEVQ